jgi:hypothetical protein
LPCESEGLRTGTVVVGLKQSEATANGKDVSISLENHCDGSWLLCKGSKGKVAKLYEACFSDKVGERGRGWKRMLKQGKTRSEFGVLEGRL